MIYFGMSQLRKQADVPCEFIGNHLWLLFFESKCNVVIVGEVESFFKDHVVLPNLSIDLLPRRLLLEYFFISIAKKVQGADFEYLQVLYVGGHDGLITKEYELFSIEVDDS